MSFSASGRKPVKKGFLLKILFLCTGNSCRSILAEATFNALFPATVRAMSAGSRPAGFVHPKSIALLKRESIPVEGLFSKSWDDISEVPDVVISVCDDAAGESCPLYLKPGLRSHWGVFDPAKTVGEERDVDAAFEKVYRILRFRIEALLAFFHSGQMDTPFLLKKELDRIGILTP